MSVAEKLLTLVARYYWFPLVSIGSYWLPLVAIGSCWNLYALIDCPPYDVRVHDLVIWLDYCYSSLDSTGVVY